ncbi:MAG TPA: trypsin-like peptidase domain-containing protein [Chthoniobacteraceae bacterium]|jgi:Do/DeqQ family serine protease|nr:trypsin-like peptidase domain-containing protein [Chthoniobacteraceae bacterium]
MRRFLLLLLLDGLGLFGYYLWHMRAPAPAHEFTAVAAPRVDTKDVQTLVAMDREFTHLIQSVVPAVVSVTTSRRVRVPLVDSFDQLFGWRGRTTELTQPAGIGSGVIVSKEGHVLTNHHVIEGSQEFTVQLTDGRSLPAKLIGSDPNVDIAVLQIDPKDTVALPIGDSDKVLVGQQVVAVGNPFGLQETVTRGIVSAKGRALRDSGVEFFQTDAAVNPGNSGGPLINLNGEVIGLNSAIFTRTGSWAGISFAIPSNVARNTLNAIVKYGHPVHGYLGTHFMSLNPSVAAQFGLRDTHGALITEVVAGSPAEGAGLKPGDVIRTYNGRPVDDAMSFRNIIGAAQIGSKAELKIVREGREMTVTTAVAELPESLARPQGERAPTGR